MIRLLLLCIVFLFILWLVLELFSKKKENKIKLSLKPKYVLFIAVAIGAYLLMRFSPKALNIFLNLKNFLIPVVGFLKNLIPFI